MVGAVCDYGEFFVAEINDCLVRVFVNGDVNVGVVDAVFVEPSGGGSTCWTVWFSVYGGQVWSCQG